MYSTAHASHRHRGLPASLLLLDHGNGEEISPELEVGLDPQVPLAHHDEGRDMLDLIGVQVLQLDLIMMQLTLEEQVRRNCESALLEEREGDDVAVRWRRRLLAARHKPLHCIGPPAEKTTLDEALHARIGNIGAMP